MKNRMTMIFILMLSNVACGTTVTPPDLNLPSNRAEPYVEESLAPACEFVKTEPVAWKDGITRTTQILKCPSLASNCIVLRTTGVQLEIHCELTDWP